MIDKENSFNEMHNDFCSFIDSFANYINYTRSKEAQNQKILECEKYLKSIKHQKYQAVRIENERYANQFFHMQCMINTLKSFLLMWIKLKENDFENSWKSLVDSQEYLAIALKINSYEGALNLQNSLKSAEELLFPKWGKYLSSGFIETVGKCSICHNLFTICDHIENGIYMGSICQRIDREIVEIDHLALVNSPRDRRCIMIKMSDDEGNEIDSFTLEKTGKRLDNSKGRNFQGIVFCFPTLDLL